MTVERTIRPRGPYSLALSGRRASDPTRRFGNGVLTCLLAGGERAGARQLSDGALVLHAETEAGIDQLRFVLGADDDHSAVPRALPRRRAARRPDPPPARPAPDPHGDRHACAPAGDRQPADHLARGALDRVAAAARDDGARRQARRTASAPPLRAASLRPSSSASACPHGRRPRSSASAARSTRSASGACPPTRPPPGSSSERGIGPYSVGFVWTQGLGRYDRGIVGDLGLLKICSAIEGRWVEPEDTARILGRYGEWAGPRVRLPDGRRGARHGAAEAEPARGQARAHQSAVRRLNSRAWLSTAGASRSSAAGRSASRCSRACSAPAGASRRRSSSRAAARSGSTSSPSATASRRRSRTPKRSAARPSS